MRSSLSACSVVYAFTNIHMCMNYVHIWCIGFCYLRPYMSKCAYSSCRMQQGCSLATLIPLYLFAMQLDSFWVVGLETGMYMYQLRKRGIEQDECRYMYMYVYIHVHTSAATDLQFHILSSSTSFRVNQRYLLSGGMVLSGVFTFLFGSLGPWLRIHSIYYYVIIWGINGMIILV